MFYVKCRLPLPWYEHDPYTKFESQVLLYILVYYCNFSPNEIPRWNPWMRNLSALPIDE